MSFIVLLRGILKIMKYIVLKGKNEFKSQKPVFWTIQREIQNVFERPKNQLMFDFVIEYLAEEFVIRKLWPKSNKTQN